MSQERRIRLQAVCDSCGKWYPQLPPNCECGACTFTVQTEPETELELERLEDPDRRPYIWERD